ncbi:RipA family octameric membrane protein [Aerosakkonema funiforme]|uniref:Uncharacterized protein n=2 Tax=Oscillatoriophycideae TaxID=1301283 RepID=A0A926VC81_9CYAN|nr:hypothetical protein [Aerosakkonema funiforme]MBD2180885.1 hypothetical protein [Aerosakkonema funiforme FACHB-1375]
MTQKQAQEEQNKDRKITDEDRKILLEQYKMYVEMMDRITERRGKMNTFYVSLLSILLALLSLLADTNKKLFSGTGETLLLVSSLLGLILCYVWYININSYKQLNKIKFKIIHEMEQYLPFACYKQEWQMPDAQKNDHLQNEQYRRLTKVEKYIPLIIAIPYFALLIYAIFSFFK